MLNQIMNTADKGLTLFEDWTLFLTVIAALLALFANVILRYGFNYTLAWSEELVKLVIIYTTFIGCSASIRNRSMIKVDVLLQLVPKTRIPLMGGLMLIRSLQALYQNIVAEMAQKTPA